MSKKFQIYIEDDIAQKIELEAKKRMVSPSNIILEIIENKYVPSPSSFLEEYEDVKLKISQMKKGESFILSNLLKDPSDQSLNKIGRLISKYSKELGVEISPKKEILKNCNIYIKK